MEKEKIRRRLNSYLGVLSHSNSFNLIKKNFEILNINFNKYFRIPLNFKKVILKGFYNNN